MLDLPRGGGDGRRLHDGPTSGTDPAYADMVDNGPLVDLLRRQRRPRRPRRSPTRASPAAVVGSTDMGNVSYLVPSIHPMIKVSPPASRSTRADFAEYAGGPEGDRAVLDGAKALAMTVADLWLRRPARSTRSRRPSTRPTGGT